jgi:hypothetical protein
MTLTIKTDKVKDCGEPQIIDEEVYDIVKFFYPEKSPLLALQTQSIANIMDCNYEEASNLGDKIKNHYGRKLGYFGTYIADFCEYLQIDEMLIQLFLASLRIAGPYNHMNIRSYPKNYDPNSPNQPMRLNEFIEHLKQHGPDSVEIVKSRKKSWKESYPDGEPCYKPVDTRLRLIIHPDEAAQILRIHLRTAQKMFQTIRDALGMPKGTNISIKKFCFYNHLEEQDVRKALAAMYGEDDDQ